MRKEVASARAVADTCTALARTWAEGGEDLITRRKEEFERQVSLWLPEGELFSVDLKAARVGIAQACTPDEVRTALSGAEMVRILLAVLSSEGPEEDSTPFILIPEDRGWDPDTLSRVMESLADAPHQVILMSTVSPTHTAEGWTVVPVGA